jgi:IS5 family transposase
LSEAGIEDAVYDSQAIRAFVGIDLNRDSAPDSTTLPKFRRLLEANALTAQIFATINGHLAEKGSMMREGTIVKRAENVSKAMTWHVAMKRAKRIAQRCASKQKIPSADVSLDSDF